MPTSVWTRSPRWIVAPVFRRSRRLLEAGALDVAVRLEPDVEAEVLEALAQVGRHVVGRRDARRHHAIGEGLRDHGPRDAHELGVEGEFGGRASLDPADAQGLRRHEPRAHVVTEGLLEARPQPVAQPVGRCPGAARVDPDALWIALVDDLCEPRPLGVVAASLGPGGGVEVPEAIAADGQTLDPAILTRLGVDPAVEEDEQRRAARGEHGLGHEGEVDGILGVLAVRHDPHVQARLAHEPRQEIVEALRGCR